MLFLIFSPPTLFLFRNRAKVHLELHLTVFNVVGRLALIEDAEGAIEGDGAEFLSSLGQGAGPHWHTHKHTYIKTHKHIDTHIHTHRHTGTHKN